MRILEKYILKEFIGPFLFGVFIFTIILVSGGILFKIVKFIIEYKISIILASKLFLFSLPSILILTFPMSVLLASLLTFNRLSSDGEIIALKAGSINIFSVILPIIIFSLLIGVLSHFLGETLVPYSKYIYNKTVNEKVKKQAFKKEGYILIKSPQDKPQLLFYWKEFDEKSKELKEICSIEFKNGKPIQTINAKSAVFEKNTWYFKDGVFLQFDDNGNFKNVLYFKEKNMQLKDSIDDLKMQQKEPEEMNIWEIKSTIYALKRSGSPEDRKKISLLYVELNNRYAFPFSTLIFALLGIPLGIKKIRSSSSVGVGISAILIFIYYVIFTFLTAWGKAGTLHPAIASWGANITFGVIGFFLIGKVNR